MKESQVEKKTTRKLTRNELILKLNERDGKILNSIYTYRCLTRTQISQIHFKRDATSTRAKRSATTRAVNKLLKYDLIKKKKYSASGNLSIAYFLTPEGIEAYRRMYSLPADIFDSDRNLITKGYYRASELDMNPRLINHQVHLNQFVIDFMYSKPENLLLRYYDEKYAGSQYRNIRPDGIISLSEVDIFLEMDMATESKRQLCDKWENYRNFINSGEYKNKEKKIIVLFIVGNTNREEARTDAIKYTLYERTLDLYDGMFDVVVGNHEDLLSHLFQHIIPTIEGENEKHKRIEKLLAEKGFSLIGGLNLSSIFQRNEYLSYARKLNSEGGILVEDGKVQEFLVDEYFNEPISIISNIAYLQRNNLLFKTEYQRDISYLIVVDDPITILEDLKKADLLNPENVFFTTLDRLEKHEIHRSLFKIDANGNIFHFKNNSLQETVFESTPPKKVI